MSRLAISEGNSGYFRSWTDLAFLRDNWDGPIILKGIQPVQDAHMTMDAHMDGIILSNRGTSLPVALRGGKPLNPCGLARLVFFWA